MQNPAVGQKVNVIEVYKPFYENGRYAGLAPYWRIGSFHGHYKEPSGRYESWTFKAEDGTYFSTCVGNQWEPVND